MTIAGLPPHLQLQVMPLVLLLLLVLNRGFAAVMIQQQSAINCRVRQPVELKP